MNDDARAELEYIHSLVESWFTSDPSPADIRLVQDRVKLLGFLMLPRRVGVLGYAPRIGNPICSEPGCKASSLSPGGLINYAGPGIDPVWYCPSHSKQPRFEEGVHHVTGTAEFSRDVMLARARDMASRWQAYLTRLESDDPATSLKEP